MSIKWKLEISLLLLSLFLTLTLGQKCSDVFRENPVCDCAHLNGYKSLEILCPNSTENHMQINYKKDHYLKIECTGDIDLESFNITKVHVKTFEILDGFKFEHVESLYLLDCPIGNEHKFLQLVHETLPRHIELQPSPEQKRKLPGTLTMMTHVADLKLSDYDLNNENLQKLPLNNFTNLVNVSLPSNNLTEINEEFSNSSISTLDLSRNKIGKISHTAFKGLRKLTILDLYSNELTELDAKIFKDLESLKSLELMDNKLETLPETAFDHLRQLILINLESNQLKELPAKLFQHNEKVQSIRLSRNRNLKQLPEGFLNHTVNLLILKLERCSLEFLHEDLFANTPKIKQINLASNHLRNLSSDLFRGLSKLEELRLERNNLANMPIGLLRDLGNLKRLFLQENQLMQIDNGVFGNLGKLQVLFLDHNQLQFIGEDSFHHLKSLYDINLSHNKLESFPESFCRDSIEKIDLSNNQLEEVNLADCVNIEHLDLSNNNLTELDTNMLLNKVRIRSVNLAHNKISNVAFTDFQSVSTNKLALNLAHNQIEDVPNLNFLKILIRENQQLHGEEDSTKQIVVDISSNPFRCDCHLYDLVRYFEEKNQFSSVVDVKTSNLVCSSPAELEDVNVLDIEMEQLVCSIENCTEDCDCLARPHMKGLIVNCANKSFQSVPNLIVHRELYGYNLSAMNIEVNLSRNYIKEFSKQNVSERSLWNFPMYSLDLSKNNLTHFEWVPEEIKVLKLHGNNLTNLHEDILERINVHTTLEDNPWNCDCDTIPFWRFLGDSPFVSNKDDIKCAKNDKPIRLMDQDELCPTHLNFIIAMIAVGALLITVPSIIAALFYKYKHEIKVWLFAHNMCLWFIQENDLDKDKLYDAFLSFSHVDEDFVIKHLLPKLEEGPNPYKLCIHLRNWVPGEFITTQIAESVANSRRTLVVLSPSFLDSVWGKMEFRTAYTTAIKEGVARVIVILYGDLDPNDPKIDDEFKVYLKTNTYIKWGDPYFWEKLKYALPHNKVKSGYINKKFESVSVNLDRLDAMNHNGNANNLVSNMTLPQEDPLLIKKDSTF